MYVHTYTYDTEKGHPINVVIPTDSKEVILIQH